MISANESYLWSRVSQKKSNTVQKISFKLQGIVFKKKECLESLRYCFLYFDIELHAIPWAGPHVTPILLLNWIEFLFFSNKKNYIWKSGYQISIRLSNFLSNIYFFKFCYLVSRLSLFSLYFGLSLGGISPTNSDTKMLLLYNLCKLNNL